MLLFLYYIHISLSPPLFPFLFFSLSTLPPFLIISFLGENYKKEYDLLSTYHTYVRDEKKYLKITYWYAMIYEKEHVLIPQLEEGITKVKWINKSNLKIYMEKTYGTIQSVIKEFLIKD